MRDVRNSMMRMGAKHAECVHVQPVSELGDENVFGVWETVVELVNE